MKLRFLGQTYYATDKQIETMPAEHTARFLGKTYNPSRPVPTVNSRNAFGEVKKYRGVPYSA